MWLLGWKLLNVSQHLAQFGVHGSSAGGDIMHLVCHVTSHDHLIKGSCRFIGGSSLQYVTTVVSVVIISLVTLEICF